MEPIVVQQWPLKPGKWFAQTQVNGKAYSTTSRSSPGCDLARQLVADGIPDCPLHVHTKGLKGYLYWHSFTIAAQYTFKGSDKHKIWQAFSEDAAGGSPIGVKGPAYAGHETSFHAYDTCPARSKSIVPESTTRAAGFAREDEARAAFSAVLNANQEEPSDVISNIMSQIGADRCC